MFLPKGFKIPHGMNVHQAEKAFRAMGECSKLVELLLKDLELSEPVKQFIIYYCEEFPLLSSSFEVQN